MKRINIYLALCLMAFLAVSCASKKDKAKAHVEKKGKERTFLRVHLQEKPDGTDRNAPITVYRAHPITINVHKAQWLDEGNIAKAEVIDDAGGFALRLQFDRRGALALENLSTAYKGQQIAIVAWFGNGTDKLRWIAAPYLTRPIKDGVLTFTPDATREEAERIALGINNVIADVEKKALIKTKDD